MTRSPREIAAYRWPAASLSSSKLCFAIHTLNLEMGVKIFHADLINTTRGNVLPKQAIYATYSYTLLILDEMQGLITPFKTQAIKLDPPLTGMDKFPKIHDIMSLQYLDRFCSLKAFFLFTFVAAVFSLQVIQRPDNSTTLTTPQRWPGQLASIFTSFQGRYDDR
nr:hypothetical protein L203_05574 [Cryptococcus depauperatus CBS 7841]